MNTLREVAEAAQFDRGRFNFYLTFLAQRLSAPDYAEAESLLHAAIDPEHAQRRHLEAIQAANEMARQHIEAVDECGHAFHRNSIVTGKSCADNH